MKEILFEGSKYFADISGAVYSAKSGNLKRLKTFQNRSGYERVCLSIENKKKNFSIHRIIAEAYLGESQLQVNHRNGNKKDNSLKNLEYVTASENMKHAYRNKLAKNQTGENNNAAKLDDIKVLTCLTMCSVESVKIKDFAGLYGVSRSTISIALSEKKWIHLPSLKKLKASLKQ